MEIYIKKTKGDVVRRFLLPRTPQHNNSIGVQWRELKRVLSATFFGSFDKLQERIKQLVRSGEAATVKMINYMLEAIGSRPCPKTSNLGVVVASMRELIPFWYKILMSNKNNRTKTGRRCR